MSSTWLRARNAMCNMLVPQVTNLKFVSATTSLQWSPKNVLVKLLFILTKSLMLWQILNFELLNSCVTLVSIIIALMTVCSQERPFGVLNYAPSHLMDSTKGASLIPRIGFATMNTILLLHFTWFYLLFSGRFAIFIITQFLCNLMWKKNSLFSL